MLQWSLSPLTLSLSIPSSPHTLLVRAILRRLPVIHRHLQAIHQHLPATLQRGKNPFLHTYTCIHTHCLSSLTHCLSFRSFSPLVPAIHRRLPAIRRHRLAILRHHPVILQQGNTPTLVHTNVVHTHSHSPFTLSIIISLSFYCKCIHTYCIVLYCSY